MKVVISQSMLFPWVGMLEQIRHADVFVHYDDVQFSKGSFTNRVQIKTGTGMRWMTVPLSGLRLGQVIQDVSIAPGSGWKNDHMQILEDSFADAPFREDAIRIAKEVYSREDQNLAVVARDSMLAVTDYFGVGRSTRFVDVVSLGIRGSSSQRVLDIVRELGGDEYVTGHGARKYLDHDLFDAAGVKVSYMEYECVPYQQQFGLFTPYVSSLDLIANCGKLGVSCIKSEAIYYKNNEPD